MDCAVGGGGGSFDAEKEAGGRVGGAKAFVGIERGEGGGVGDVEEMAWDFGLGGIVMGGKDDAGVGAEMVEMAADGCGTDEGEPACGVGDLARGAVGMEGAVDEEEDGHRGSSCEADKGDGVSLQGICTG